MRRQAASTRPAAEPYPGLNERARAVLERDTVVREYGPDEPIWLSGGSPNGLYVILEGTVRIVRAAGGRQHVVHTEQAGATIGEVPLFDGGPYPATALAQTRVRCRFVPRHTLELAIAADPALAWTLLRGLSRRIRILVDGLSDARLRTVRSRVARRLLDRSDAAADAVVTLGGTHADVAESLGTVREVVTREIAILRRRAILRSSGRGGYEILDRSALEAVATGSS